MADQLWPDEALEDVVDAIIDGLNETKWDGSGSPAVAARQVLAALSVHAVPRALVERVLQLDNSGCSGQSYNLLNAIVRAPDEIEEWR